EARLARTRKDAAFGPASAASRRTPQREQAVAQKATVFALDDPIGNQRRIGHQPAFQIGATLRRVDRARGQLGLPQHLRERPGSREDFGERSEEHTSELQSPYDLVCRLLLEKKKKNMLYILCLGDFNSALPDLSDYGARQLICDGQFQCCLQYYNIPLGHAVDCDYAV